MNATGHKYVWAIDPATTRLAFAFAAVGSKSIEVETLNTTTDRREGERLGLLDRQVRIYARQRAADFPPAVVWVEQPGGRFRNLPLTYAVGVVQAALFEALGVPVWTIPSSTWKQRALGAGNATKPQVRAWAEHLVAVGSEDEADAVAIAWAGRAMLDTGRWGAA